MLTRNTSMMSASFPSLISAYDSENATIYDGGLSDRSNPTHHGRDEPSPCPPCPDQPLYSTADSIPRTFDRRNSTGSGRSYSTESSPTTTSSTFDSPSLADMPCSPSSSPESASSAAPPKSFQSSSSSSSKDPLANGAFPLYQPACSPHAGEESKRNVKNLTLDMKLPTLLRPATSAGGDPSLHPFSAPTSPLKEALRTGRRKPTNLTIRTPGFNQLAFPRSGEAPASPGTQPMLLHPPLSSPSLPTRAPPGGLHFHMPNIDQRVQQDSWLSPEPSNPMVSSLPDLREDAYQPPPSQEAPERGYTDGPVKIYDTGIYLYLEPTAEEASEFDIVINCAKEIKDPFEREHQSETVMSLWRNNAADKFAIAEPQTAMSEISFKSAWEWPSTNDPTTPKASDPSRPRPEYLHVPWDHNSEILDDLYPLCEIIDDRVHRGHKVLIHCQLGVSRSASLIIAYGLYKGYETDFHSMYMAVKKRSQWVGPNMSLIYQLTDFRAKCARGDYPRDSKTANPSWFVHSHENAATPVAATPQHDRGPEERKPAGSHPERPPLRLNKELPPVPPGPPSQASDPQQQVSMRGVVADQIASTTGKPHTARPSPFSASATSIPPHRSHRFQPLGIPEPRSFMDLARQDVPDSPSLFSPRAAEFVASPFGVNTAGDLVTSAPKRRRPPPGAFPGGNEWRQSLRMSMDLSQDISKLLSHDPRSPPQAAEAKEIIRSIDDVL